MVIGDFVVRKSYGEDITFKIIDIINDKGIKYYVLKGVNLRIIADSPERDLRLVKPNNEGKVDSIFNEKINNSIKNIMIKRSDAFRAEQSIVENIKTYKKKKMRISGNSETVNNMTFARPGKVLHIDGDSEYLEVCLKVYKQLSIDAVGKVMPEREQPNKIVGIVKDIKPDIVVITGHDSMIKGAKDYMDINNYRNSAYFIKSVSNLRDYEPSYDDLVIFAGACQSCYEGILNAGANYASSPGRVLIHCLDPVFVSEKVAYTNVGQIVNIKDVVKGTVTGVKGIGGLQTRGKCREGYPRSTYIT
ncbi:sporulation peptidase YabG [Clostridium felsineum]|uniref:Sporulation-specific protease YabG n=1 Tax=Clostridium felsineum TaxID=36839 RepID=A0A1S8M270_9CLOT|nr:sporulation peptidase YabG [Clostridium felsineum]MCR3758349.1 sporulation peptidase YabG [Clostridium felsineum]URZ07984.1 Sporulation-specific protease YabG [Clostridium felsineum]URZ13015.1 Sporulation-specific protease YabG [Clostridium felsineum]URZ14994.1 Sporulation-specific protease YabG [Clostridium felsineum DSM 794]